MKNKILVEVVIFVAMVLLALVLLRPKFAILLNNKAMEYVEGGRLDEAANLLQLALQLSEDSKMHAHLGQVYYKKGNIGLSIAEYERAIEVNPQYLEGYYMLAALHTKANLYQAAMADLNKARSLDPVKAEEEIRKLQFEYAVSLFSDAVDAYQRSNVEQALSKLKEAIVVSPQFVLPHGLLGDICLRRNMYQEAIEHYGRAIALGLKDPMVFNNIGICYMRLENYRDGIVYLRKAHELAPSDVYILYSLAGTLRDNDQGAQALALFKELVSRQYDYPGVHNDIAHIYEKWGQYEDAKIEFKNEADIDKAKLEKNQNDEVSWTNLAIAYKGLGDYQLAKTTIEKVLQRDPMNGEALYTRALIYEKMGMKNAALEDLKKAKEFFVGNDFIDKDIRRLKNASL